jgi:hypothetical protein
VAIWFLVPTMYTPSLKRAEILGLLDLTVTSCERDPSAAGRLNVEELMNAYASSAAIDPALREAQIGRLSAVLAKLQTASRVPG